MKKTLIIAMAFYCLSAKAQQEPRNFVYLYNDSMITARQVSLRPDAFNSLQVYTGKQRYPAQQVQFFKNEYGFFANTKKLNYLGQSEFVERVVEGKINLYDRVAYDPHFDVYDSPMAVQNPYQISNRKTVFFNKNFGPLMKINYNNLKNELQDNPISVDFLVAYRNSQRTSTVFYSAAGAAILAGLVSFIVIGTKDADIRPGFGNMDKQMPNFTTSFILLGVGAGFSLGGVFHTMKARNHLFNAVNAYNR